MPKVEVVEGKDGGGRVTKWTFTCDADTCAHLPMPTSPGRNGALRAAKQHVDEHAIQDQAKALMQP